MACFLVPAATGVITTVFRKKFPKRWHVNWLNTMIFGGAMALTAEHIAHQEIVLWPPFLTAMSSQSDMMAMFGEMAAVGIPMTVALVLGWIAIVVAYEKMMAIKAVPAGASGA